ncbi:MAG TPA: hypothetical protein VMD59_10380 [Acidimicrobiales bacterium]|nr:hypothetical protein [Acidimicrobiales bacterium]
MLLLALHRPGDLAPLLEAGVLDRLLFFDDVQRAAFDALAEADELHEAIAAASPEVAVMITELAVSEPPPDSEPAEQTVLGLARHAAERARSRAEAEARLAEQDADSARLARANTSTTLLQDLLALLNDPIAAGAAAREAAQRLVASLQQQSLEEA